MSLRLFLFNLGSRLQEIGSRGSLYGETLIDRVQETFGNRQPRRTT